MKTWKQLEAMAKRHGYRVDHGRHGAGLANGDADLVSVESWLERKVDDRVQRAAIEAALLAMKGAKR